MESFLFLLHRIAVYWEVVSRPLIDLEVVKQLAFQGIPDDYALRSLYWKLLLGYLSPDSTEWPQACLKQRDIYHQYCRDFALAHDSLRVGLEETFASEIASLHVAEAEAEADNTGNAAAATPTPLAASDHPLSLNPSSQWASFFQDTELLAEISRDIPRTHPEAHGFNRESLDGQQKQAALTRILFVWGKLNAIGYVQGMNEVLFPLYYVFSHVNVNVNDKGRCALARAEGDNVRKMMPLLTCGAEEDTFFCFNAVMTVLRDLYTEFLDGSIQHGPISSGSASAAPPRPFALESAEEGTGLHATLSRFSRLLHTYAETVYLHLESMEIEPHYYALRWLTLLLAKEFSLPDIMRLWDSVFSFREYALDYVLFLGLSLVLEVRDTILSCDFASALELLQNLPPLDVVVVLEKAELLMRKSGMYALKPPLLLSRVSTL